MAKFSGGTYRGPLVCAVFKGTTITLIILVLCLSYPHAHKSNLHDFFPYHDSGVFAGAAVVGLLLRLLPWCGSLKPSS